MVVEAMPVQEFIESNVTSTKRRISVNTAAAIHGPKNILMTPDGKGCANSVIRKFSDLYLVEGLK